MAELNIGDVAVSPDGTEQVVTSRAQAVELKFAGWAPRHQRAPRRPRKPPIEGRQRDAEPRPNPQTTQPREPDGAA